MKHTMRERLGVTPEELNEAAHRFAIRFSEFIDKEVADMVVYADRQAERMRALHDEICPEPKEQHNKCVELFMMSTESALGKALVLYTKKEQERKARLN